MGYNRPRMPYDKNLFLSKEWFDNMTPEVIMTDLKSAYGYIFQDPKVSDKYKENLRQSIHAVEMKLNRLEELENER